MDEWINYTHTHNEWNINGILFNSKTNEVLIHATTGECCKHAEQNKPSIKGHILYDSIYKKASRIGRLLETKSRFAFSDVNGSGCLMVLVFLFG